MKINKIIFIILWCLSCLFVFGESRYNLKQILFTENLELSKLVEREAKKYLNKNNLCDFLITDGYELYLGNTRGKILLLEFSEGKQPFRRDYLIELYFDELDNYIKSELLDFYEPAKNRKKLPVIRKSK